MKYLRIVTVAVCLISVQHLYSQGTLDDVHPFQSFFRDAAISDAPYIEGMFGFSNYDNLNVLNIGARGTYHFNSQFGIGASLAFLNFDPDVGDGESGISDLRVVGLYHFPTRTSVKISAGGFIVLPIGSEDLGQEEGNFGVFGAVRYPVTPGTVVIGSLSLDFLEGIPVEGGGWPVLFVGGDRETVLRFGGGVIHEITNEVSVVGELNFTTEGEFGLLTGGVDYALRNGGRVRGSLGVGLDDGAPDVSLIVTFLQAFR
ncbi:hypothetical protein GWO43_18695 [candidate division KSB1 bacterium]|nr:hypothetical protein [candidate division KSB1 bacterium]NIR72862.1 hypothetical protein [candidate division KSB1 bacterium]NIS26064.1 hypothetical protein [candidate division KSB1 bacterium]NIT72864.1 hypothetical protein [candidate division KSB1 bacterium]NIU26710.1 hypothetical protein [candidate division KSB1 bacterium]